MKYAVNSTEMKKYDRNTSEYYGISSEVLMERASLKVVSHILDWTCKRASGRKFKALVLCGVGNNGGDGACIARLLKQNGIIPYVCVVGDYTKCSDLLLKQLDILKKYGVSTDTFSHIRDNKSPAEFDIIVDALFGIGLSRPVTGDFAEAVSFCNRCKEERQSDILVISVDIASGINADDGKVCDDAVKADETVTFNFAKLGHLLYPGCEYAGKLYIEDVGITEDSFLGVPPYVFYYDDNVKELIPDRRRDSNKGTNGKVLVIAGSWNISGACVLASKACLSAGAGMIRVFTASANKDLVNAVIPESMVDVYSNEADIKSKLQLLTDWSSAVVLGPGIGKEETAYLLVKEILSSYDKDLVLDADALNIIAEHEELKKLASEYSRNGKRLILTPHIGEFARLFGCSIKECKDNILFYPKKLADSLHCTVVCKDARTIVADSNEKRVYINLSGNDGMATAGSGDVLAGIMGAMLSHKMSAFETACASVYLHGLAGDEAAGKYGKSFMKASSIIESLKYLIE